MQWWNNFVDWFYSPTGQTVLFSAVIPFVAILAAGIIAAAIARGSIAHLLRSREEELKTSAVIGLLDGARQASVWHSLLPNEQLTADRLMGAADVQLRLLPIPGASVAANWAGHEIREFKRASATFTLQFDAPLAEFRDRLIDWERHPRRARKIFERDLARWSEEKSHEDQLLQQEQDAWAEQQRPTGTGAVSLPPTPVLVPVDAGAARDLRRDEHSPDERRDKHSPEEHRDEHREERSGPMRQVRPDEPFRRPDRISEPVVTVSSVPDHPEPQHLAPPAAYPAAYLDAEDDDVDDVAQTTTVVPRLGREVSPADHVQPTVVPSAGSALSRPLRPSLPTQISDVDEEPGSVERPTDEPYAPPVPAAFGRARPARD